MTRLLWTFTSFSLTLLCAAASAHHSSAPHYDATKPVEIDGTVEHANR